MKSVPRPVLLLIASFLCPTELSLYLGDLRLPPHRLALILLLPLALFRIVSRPDIRLRAFDFLFISFGLWTVWVYGQHAGNEGTVYGGSLALESLGGFLVARAWIRDEATMYGTLRVMMVAIVLSALIALPETLFGQTFTHDFLHQMTGYKHPTAVETRSFNLARAYGTFDHPIHYGTFCAALFALFWFAEKKTMPRARRAAIIGGATMLGISAAPLLCIGLQAAMLGWERMTRGTAQRTPMTLAVLVGLYIGASMVSNRSPINLIATGMTFDAWTGFYRLQIWEHGLNNVWESPLLGIGLAEWDRPMWMVSSTIDAFWLVTALRAGIPAFLLLAAAIIVLGRGVVLRGIKNRNKDIKRLATGWMMSLIALCLIACTVHYWNVLNAFFFFFLGIGGWFADPKKAPARAAVPQRQTAEVPRAPRQVTSGGYGAYAGNGAAYGMSTAYEAV
jgi:O-antigen ligase